MCFVSTLLHLWVCRVGVYGSICVPKYGSVAVLNLSISVSHKLVVCGQKWSYGMQLYTNTIVDHRKKNDNNATVTMHEAKNMSLVNAFSQSIGFLLIWFNCFQSEDATLENSSQCQCSKYQSGQYQQ